LEGETPRSLEMAMLRGCDSLLMLMALMSGAGTSSAAEEVRPNVVFLLADDLGREDCGFMGGKEIKT
jgi:hypothetical protein